MSNQKDKIKAVVIPAAQVISAQEAVDFQMMQDGAMFYCTVTLKDESRRYYRVEETIEVTPTDANWKRL